MSCHPYVYSGCCNHSCLIANPPPGMIGFPIKIRVVLESVWSGSTDTELEEDDELILTGEVVADSIFYTSEVPNLGLAIGFNFDESNSSGYVQIGDNTQTSWVWFTGFTSNYSEMNFSSADANTLNWSQYGTSPSISWSSFFTGSERNLSNFSSLFKVMEAYCD